LQANSENDEIRELAEKCFLNLAIELHDFITNTGGQNMIELKQHIEIRSDDPLDAVLSGTNANAHLVANLALLDGVEAAIEQYDLTHSQVYAAVSFYYDYQDTIEQQRSERDLHTQAVGVDSEQYLKELGEQNDKNDSRLSNSKFLFISLKAQYKKEANQ
jgi:hypothetical protein